jgi:hypothetical protein
MNSTTAPPLRTRLPWRSDLLTALTGLALEAVAAFSIIIASGLTNGADPRGANGGADRADQILVLGFTTLACLALLVALLLRAKAPITAAAHLLLAAAFFFAAFAVPSAEPTSRAPSSLPAGRAP